MDSMRIDTDKLTTFQKTFKGTLISPSDSNYDHARKVWNHMIDRRPALIAQCSGTQDVVRVVRPFGKNQI